MYALLHPFLAVPSVWCLDLKGNSHSYIMSKRWRICLSAGYVYHAFISMYKCMTVYIFGRAVCAVLGPERKRARFYSQ